MLQPALLSRPLGKNTFASGTIARSPLRGVWRSIALGEAVAGGGTLIPKRGAKGGEGNGGFPFPSSLASAFEEGVPRLIPHAPTFMSFAVPGSLPS